MGIHFLDVSVFDLVGYVRRIPLKSINTCECFLCNVNNTFDSSYVEMSVLCLFCYSIYGSSDQIQLLVSHETLHFFIFRQSCHKNLTNTTWVSQGVVPLFGVTNDNEQDLSTTGSTMVPRYRIPILISISLEVDVKVWF